MELNPKSTKVAVSLIVVSFLMWLAFIVIPFWPISALRKAVIAGMILIVAEVFFWVGALIIGVDAARKVWPGIAGRLSSWFKK